MSSHHFVKEGQEPAIFIHGDIPWAVVADLLEWSPYVLISEEFLQKVLAWGIKIDAVIGESRQILQTLNDMQPVKIIRCNEGEDAVDAALGFLLLHGQNSVYIAVDEPEFFFEKVTPLQEKFFISIIGPGRRWYYVRQNFSKHVPVGTSFLLFSPVNEQITYQGVVVRDNFLISPEDAAAAFSARFPFWVGESL